EQGLRDVDAVLRCRPGIPPASEIDHGAGHPEARTAFRAPLLRRVPRPPRTGSERSDARGNLRAVVCGPAGGAGPSPARLFSGTRRSLVAYAGCVLRCRARARLDLLAANSTHGASSNPVDGLSPAAR